MSDLGFLPRARAQVEGGGFRRITSITNAVTCEQVPVDIEIHAGDIDWLLELHQQSFALDWEIHLAETRSAA